MTSVTALQRAAVHESGHVVAAWALGLPTVVRVSVGVGGGGTTWHADVTEDPLLDLLSRVAGAGAEELAFGDVTDGCTDDNARADAASWALTGDLDACDALVRQARQVVRDELLFPRWPTVELVALALLQARHNVLDGAALAAFERPAAFDLKVWPDGVGSGGACPLRRGRLVEV